MVRVAKGDVVVAGVLVLLDAIRFDPGSDEFGGKGIERGAVWRSKADVVEANPVFVKAVAGNRLAGGNHEDPRWPSLEPEATGLPFAHYSRLEAQQFAVEGARTLRVCNGQDDMVDAVSLHRGYSSQYSSWMLSGSRKAT